MCKRNRGVLPNVFSDMLMKRTSLHNNSVTQHRVYRMPHCKTNTRQNSSAYAGPKLWNTIITKNQTEDCRSIIIFKKAMKRYTIVVNTH